MHVEGLMEIVMLGTHSMMERNTSVGPQQHKAWDKLHKIQVVDGSEDACFKP
jgi:hypothetical protein